MLEEKKPKILVVDDIEINLQLIVNVVRFGDEDYEVITANNAIDGCKIAESELPDIILMDWEMPKMSGIEAIRHLKGIEKTKNIPILMVTAYSTPELIEEAFEAGAIDYIKKPVNAIELRSRIKSSLRLNSSIRTINEQNNKIDTQSTELKKLALVARKTSHSFIILDLNGNIDWVNKGFEELHEYTPEQSKEIISKSIFDNPLYSDFIDTFQKCINQKTDEAFTIQIHDDVSNTDTED